MKKNSSNRLIKGLLSTTLGLGAFAAVDANATGFQLREVSGTLQGTSYAGMATSSLDASTIFFNPANVGKFDQSEASAGGILVMPRVTSSQNSASTGMLNVGANVSQTGYGDMAQDALVPNAHAVWVVNDRVNAGLSITAPWGMVTKYDTDFAGRYFGKTSDIQAINVKPVLSYKVNDAVTIAGGLQVQYFDARLTKASNNLAGVEGTSAVKGDDYALGWTAGVNWDVSEDTRVGASYISRINHKLKGKVTFSDEILGGAAGYTNQQARAKVSTPEIVTVGISHKVTPDLEVMADLQWTNWDTLSTLDFQYAGPIITIPGLGPVTSTSEEYNWDDSWFASLGARYKMNEKLTLMGGLAYDQAPMSAKNRSVRLPDVDRYWVSVGALYQPTKNIDLSLGYTRIFGHTERVSIADAASGTFEGKYSAGVDILAAQAQFKF